MLSRRMFLIGGSALAGAVAGTTCRPMAARHGAWPLRPPGALPEKDFLAACIRCEACIQVCPHDALKPTPLRDGLGAGSPQIDSRRAPCFLCNDFDELKCIAACPSGALQDPGGIENITMGVAVIDEERCLAFNGVVCRSCWHACPFPNQAIRFDSLLRPVIDREFCIGCGICDHACLAEPTAIRIDAASGAGVET